MNIADRIQSLRKAKGILLSDYFETTTDYLLRGVEPARPFRTRKSGAPYPSFSSAQ